VVLIIYLLLTQIHSAWTVKARNNFRSAGIQSDLGRYAYGFTWATFVCFLLAMILFCCGGAAGKKKDHGDDDMPREERERNGFFARNKTTDQDNVGTVGVKDDYS